MHYAWQHASCVFVTFIFRDIYWIINLYNLIYNAGCETAVLSFADFSTWFFFFTY